MVVFLQKLFSNMSAYLLFISIFCFFVFVVLYFLLGGVALNGYSDGGGFYLKNGEEYIEVSELSYNASLIVSVITIISFLSLLFFDFLARILKK